jgi:hypothetical protein
MALSQAFMGDVGSAVDGIFGAIGSAKAAQSYTQAAKIALQNEQLAKESTQIQQVQAQRQIFQTIGGQASDVAGAGFSMKGGNAGDLLRSSASQGALQRQLIGVQGLITANSYEQQANAYSAQAAASKAASTGGIFKSILSIASAAMTFSDETLKRDITRVGPSQHEGINIYLFRYGPSPTIYSGVLAQEVLKVRPDCVEEVDGLLAVDYARLGIPYEAVA